jgi:Fur family ferric uptake transcriptional regulator
MRAKGSPLRGDQISDEKIHARLHAAGLRMTEPRRRLLDLFMGMEHWCTPQELHGEARRKGLSVGLATVYRLVEALVGVGLCRPFVLKDRTLRYVFCPPTHHHHLICDSCGRVTDLDDCHVEPPTADFRVRAHSVDFFGVCGSCQGKRKVAR